MVVLAVVLLGSVPAHAQVTDNQAFRVVVPSNMTIQAPVASVSIDHDETDGDQPFAVQQWQVRANNRLGATVTFETDQAFTHDTDSSFKRDAKLELAIDSPSLPAGWVLDTATDQTDYAGSDEVEAVHVPAGHD